MSPYAVFPVHDDHLHPLCHIVEGPSRKDSIVFKDKNVAEAFAERMNATFDRGREAEFVNQQHIRPGVTIIEREDDRAFWDRVWAYVRRKPAGNPTPDRRQ